MDSEAVASRRCACSDFDALEATEGSEVDAGSLEEAGPGAAGPWGALGRLLPGTPPDPRRLSRALTVRSALRRLALVEPGGGAPALQLRLLGCTDAREGAGPEASLALFEPLRELLRGGACRELHLLACGPELTQEGEACAAGGAPGAPRLVLSRRRGLYHELRGGLGSLPAPQLAVAFNAGLWAQGTWEPTVRALRHEGCPLVVTSYCEYEAELDEAALEQMGVTWLWRWARNPWRSLVAESGLESPWTLYENCCTQCVL